MFRFQKETYLCHTVKVHAEIPGVEPWVTLTLTVLQDLQADADRPYQVDEFFIQDNRDGALSSRYGFESGTASRESIPEAVETFLSYHGSVIANLCVDMGYTVPPR
jgi:hypothetical protein